MPTYRDRGGFRLIEITLREPRQLFNNLDPAPFHEKDLDATAEEYIVTAAREIGLAHPTKIAIYLPAAILMSEDAQHVPAAIHNYFAYREQHTRRELRDLLRTGLIILVIGLAFLFVCLSARGAGINRTLGRDSQRRPADHGLGGDVATDQRVPLRLVAPAPAAEDLGKSCRDSGRVASA